MFWLLIAIFFNADGSKNVQTKFEISEAACVADVTQFASDFHGHQAKELLGVGFKCDGPLDDPTIPKKGA